MNETFLAVLACPKSKRKLILASDEILEKVNQRIKKGQLKNQKGDLVKKKITAALVEEKAQILYIIEDNIPRLMVDQAIDFSNL